MTTSASPANESFLILGHCGCRNASIQKNSYSAFMEALSVANGLETDASPSKDGVVFLIHDTTYIRQVEYTPQNIWTMKALAALAVAASIKCIRRKSRRYA